MGRMAGRRHHATPAAGFAAHAGRAWPCICRNSHSRICRSYRKMDIRSLSRMCRFFVASMNRNSFMPFSRQTSRSSRPGAELRADVADRRSCRAHAMRRRKASRDARLITLRRARPRDAGSRRRSPPLCSACFWHQRSGELAGRA